MAKGKRWSQQEIKLLREMLEKGMSLDEIVKSGEFPDRTAIALQTQIFRLGSIASQSKKFVASQITPGEGVISIEEVLKRFSTAFKQICELTEVDKWELKRFRIIFSAAKDYGPLLAHYERMKQVEGEIADLRKMVEEVKAQVSARNP